MGIASLVLGILAALISFIPCLGTYAMIPGVIGIVLGLLGMRNVAGRGVAIAGLVLSIVGTTIAYWQYQQINKATSAVTDAFNEIVQSAPKLETEGGSLSDLAKQLEAAGAELSKQAEAAGAELQQQLEALQQSMPEIQ